MAEEIKVKPTPIQRNTNDVAMELTHMYYKNRPVNSVEELQNNYIKFYSVASALENSYSSTFKEFIPKELNDANDKARNSR